MNIFDSHAHYYDSWFDEYDGGAYALLDKLFAENVEYIINIGTNYDNSLKSIEMAKKYDKMFVAVGLHPEDCLDIEDVDDELAKIENLLQNKGKIVAIGEIGLDYHIENISESQKEKQKYVFIQQMELAKKHHLPVIIHDREAHGDCLEISKKYPDVIGVYHCYSGSKEMASELLKLGYYISFTGVVTFKNSKKPREVLASIPLDRILIETDCPYMAPEPYRGTLNHSGNIIYTVKAFAEAFSKSDEEMLEITSKNAKKLFNIK